MMVINLRSTWNHLTSCMLSSTSSGRSVTMSRWMYSGHTWEVRYSRELRKQYYIVSNGRQERKKEAARRERGVMYTL